MIISDLHGGRALELIYNSRAKCWPAEAFDGILSKSSQSVTLAILLTASAIRENLKTSKDGIIHFIAHSNACTVLKKALKLLSPEERDRLHISAFAPGSLIGKDLCENAKNYINKYDLVGHGTRAAHLMKFKQNYNVVYICKIIGEIPFWGAHEATNQFAIDKLREVSNNLERRFGNSDADDKAKTKANLEKARFKQTGEIYEVEIC